MRSSQRRLRLLPAVVAVVLSTLAGAQSAPSVSYEGKPIKFAKHEQPYYTGPAAMLPLRPICQKLGANLKERKDRSQWSVVRGADRIDYVMGDSSFSFNGIRKNLTVQPERHGSEVFVPFELIQSISGGALELESNLRDRPVELFYRDRRLHLKKDEAPFRSDGVIYVPARACTAIIGAKFEQSRDGIRLTITRSADRLTYDQGLRWYMFNGAQRSIGGESILRSKVIFVPIEIFQSLVGDELRGR